MSMLPPSPLTLSNMSAAAATTECRLKGTGTTARRINPNKDQTCCVRIQGDLIVRYKIGAAGDPALPPFVHREAARRFDRTFHLCDTDTFFRSYTACRDGIHLMLMHTPLLREFDLAADKWDYFTPHSLATTVVHSFRRDTQKLGGVALRYNIDMDLTIWADIVYDEPKTLPLPLLS